MKVVAINGSPNKEGNTFLALSAVCEQLREAGIETEIVHIGNKAIRGCVACNTCAKTLDRKCVIADEANEAIRKMAEADGIILGSPVYFAGMTGTMKSFLDRAFKVAGANGNLFRHKAGASVVADRRAGGVSTVDQMNHYLSYAEIFVPGSTYWNVTYGRAPGEIAQDTEGMQTMRALGKNMVWLLRMRAAGMDSLPAGEKKIIFNYIR